MSINQFEGEYPCILMVCSAGILRSPTAAEVGVEFGWNTRAVGAMRSYALTPVNAQLLMWAHKILCMTEEHKLEILSRYTGLRVEEKIIVLGIEDNYNFREVRLQDILRAKFKEIDENIQSGL